MFTDAQLRDTQAALGFLIGQTSHIETQVWQKKYPELTYAEDVPIDNSAHPYATSVTYFSSDGKGKAEWLHGRGQDFPMVDVDRAKHETPVAMAGIGYDYTLEEIAQARMLSINLTADKAHYARRAYEEKCDGIAYVGDDQKGFKGLLNYPTVAAAEAPAGEGAANTTWETKTPDEILADINGAISGMYVATNTIELADTVLLPLTSYLHISTRRLDSTRADTVLDHILRANIYTMQTGKPLRIRARRELEDAGAGGTKRMVTYKRDPSVLKLHRPMPLQFLAAQQHLTLFVVPGMFRLGGLDIRRPGAVRYTDHI